MFRAGAETNFFERDESIMAVGPFAIVFPHCGRDSLPTAPDRATGPGDKVQADTTPPMRASRHPF